MEKAVVLGLGVNRQGASEALSGVFVWHGQSYLCADEGQGCGIATVTKRDSMRRLCWLISALVDCGPPPGLYSEFGPCLNSLLFFRTRSQLLA